MYVLTYTPDHGPNIPNTYNREIFSRRSIRNPHVPIETGQM